MSNETTEIRIISKKKKNEIPVKTFISFHYILTFNNKFYPFERAILIYNT